MASHIADLKSKLQGFFKTAAEELWIEHYKSKLHHFADLAEDIEFLFEHVEMFVDENDRFTKESAPGVVVEWLKRFLLVGGGGSPLSPKGQAVAWFIDELRMVEFADLRQNVIENG